MNAHDYDEVTTRIAIYHGLDPDDAENVIERLGITDTADREYLYRHPDHLSPFDDESTSDKTAGHSGWVVWFETSDTAISVINGDPEHHENVDSLDAAIEAASL